MGHDFTPLPGEEQGDVTGTLQYQVKASFGDVQEYKEAPEVGVS